MSGANPWPPSGPPETLIYGRFGYGLTAQSDRASIDRRHTEFRAEVPEAPGEVRFVDSDAALERWPPLYERLRESRPGMMNRIPGHWSAFIIPRAEKPEGGFSRRQYVEYSGADGPEGYAIYAVKSAWPEGVPRGTVRVHELVAKSPAVEATLWRYLFGIDLVETIEAGNRPPDDPLLWMLADLRHLRRLRRDTIWLRILDVPKALEGRSYLPDGRLVLNVSDPFGPWATGRFELVGRRRQRVLPPHHRRAGRDPRRRRPRGRLPRRCRPLGARPRREDPGLARGPAARRHALRLAHRPLVRRPVLTACRPRLPRCRPPAMIAGDG